MTSKFVWQKEKASDGLWKLTRMDCNDSTLIYFGLNKVTQIDGDLSFWQLIVGPWVLRIGRVVNDV